MKQNRTVARMKDVAEEAGVSLGTVSKVINGKPVGEEYVRKVNDAIRKLNYHVNSYAQGLKASRTYTVAVIVPNTYHPFYGMLAYWLNASLTRRGYRMLLCCTDHDPRQEQEYVYMAQQNKVDGIIGLTYNEQLEVPEDTAFVSIDRHFHPLIPCVASDNFAGGQLAAEKLADLGCRKVLFLRTGSSINNEPNKRKAGFENGCIARGLSYEMEILTDEEWNTESDVKEHFRMFLQNRVTDGKADFDGIFCVTDTLAFMVRTLLEEMGLRVPEDVQLIGFDGTKWLNNLQSSGYLCSTIVQPIESIAEMSVDLLLENSMSIKPPLVCLPVTFAEGGTTKSGSHT